MPVDGAVANNRREDLGFRLDEQLRWLDALIR